MVDFGTEVNLNRWGTLFSLTPYYGRIKDIVSYWYTPHPTLPGVTIIKSNNLGEAGIYGVELGLKQRITKELGLFVSSTWNHSEITKDRIDPAKEGNELRNAPDYWGSIGLDFKKPNWFNGRLVLRFSDTS